MQIDVTPQQMGSDVGRSYWGAIIAMSLTAFALVASEFMPVSLLTPIAGDLAVTEGRAGQSIACSGIFAMITSLVIATAVKNADRKLVLLSLTALMIVSSAIVSFAPSFLIFMFGRALLGIAIGGFWAMSAATAMRLVPTSKVPQALAVLNGGNALAMVLGAPLGSYLGGLIGWRGAFLIMVPVAVCVLLWKSIALPPMKVRAAASTTNPLKLLARPSIAWGMAASCFFFMGHFSLFTYLRPFLESATRVDVPTLSTLLLMMGVMGFTGTILIGPLVNKHLRSLLVAIPVAMACVAVGLIAFGSTLSATAALLALWGLLGTSAPVAWWAWVAKSLPQDAEAGGGLMVAVAQLAITLGAILGGIAFDMSGYQATFAMSSALLVIAAVVASRAR